MDDFINGLALLGIPAVILVPLFVQGLKVFGLPDRWAGAAAMLLGVLVAVLIEAVAAWPAITPLVRILVAGVLLGLAAAGTYSQYKVFR